MRKRSWKSGQRRWAGRLAAAVAGACLWGAPANGAVVNSSWKAAVNGDWSLASNWTPSGMPNNGGNTYNVRIEASGAPYLVQENRVVTVSNFTLNSSDATFDVVPTAILTSSSAANLQTGLFRLAGGTVKNTTLSFNGATGAIVGTGSTLENSQWDANLTLNPNVTLTLSTNAGFGAHTGLNRHTLNLSNNSALIAGNNTTLNNFILAADSGSPSQFRIGSNQAVTFASGMTIRGGGLTIDQVGAGYQSYLTNNGLISADLTGQTLIVGSPYTCLHNPGGTLEAANGGTLRIGYVQEYFGSAYLGIARALGAGSRLTIADGDYTINKPVTATGDATGNALVDIGGYWTIGGTGAINLTNATANLGGTFTPSSTTTITRTGNTTVNLTGTMDNTGNIFTFNNTTGSWNFAGGTIKGGTVELADGQSLIPVPGTTNRLDGVNFNADLTIPTDAHIWLENSVASPVFGDGTPAGAHTVSLSSGAVLAANAIATDPFDPQYTQTLDNFTIASDSTTGTAAEFRINDASTITFGENLKVRGGNLIIGKSDNYDQPRALINQGDISADVAGQTITVGTVNCTVANQSPGTLQAKNGGTLNLTNFSGPLNTLTATGAASTVVVDGLYTVNTPITASDGGTLTLNGSWTIDTGSIDLTNATANLGGTFTLPPTVDINRTGVTTVNLTGIWDNIGKTFTFSNTTGSWNLVGGTVKGGRLDFADGQGLVPTGTLPGILDDVVFNSDLNIPSGRRLWLRNGTTFGDRTVAGRRSVFLAGGAVLAADGTQTLDNFTIAADSGLPSEFRINYTSTVTLGLQMIVRGGSLVVGNTDDRTARHYLNNQGTISADLVGQNITVGGFYCYVTNTGTLEAKNGASLDVAYLNGPLNTARVDGVGSALSIDGVYTLNKPVNATNNAALTLKGNWSIDTATGSTGWINVTDSAVNLGGAFTLPDAIGITRSSLPSTTVNLTGIWDNTGKTFTFNNTTGSWNFAGGTVKGGTVNFADGQELIPIAGKTSTLEGVTFNSNLTIPTSAHIWLRNAPIIGDGTSTGGKTLSLAAGAVLAADGTQTLDNFTIASDSTGGSPAQFAVNGASIVTLGSKMLVRGGNLTIGSTDAAAGPHKLINQGAISADVAGQAITIGTSEGYTVNTGVFEARNAGTLFVDYLDAASYSGGTLSGGAYKVYQNSVMRLGARDMAGGSVPLNIQALDATILLDGDNARLFNSTTGTQNALDPQDPLDPNGTTLTTITANGTLELDHGAVVERGGSLFKSLTSAGQIKVGAGSRFRSNGGLDWTGGSASGQGTVEILAGNVTISGSVTKTGNGPMTVAPGYQFVNNGSLTVAGGSLTIASVLPQITAGTLTGGVWNISGGATLAVPPGNAITTNQGTVTLNGLGSTFAPIDTLADNQGTFGISQGRDFTTAGDLANSGAINVGADTKLTVSGNLSGIGAATVAGTLQANRIGQNTLTIQDKGKVAITPADTTASQLVALDIQGSGQLDIGPAALAIRPATWSDQVMTDLVAKVNSGRSVPATPWTGPGIVSSLAATDAEHLTVAVVRNMGADSQPLFTGWHGLTSLDTNSILITTTLFGDADLSGSLDGDDYFFIDRGFTASLSGFNNGDFNLDGAVDIEDYFLIDATYLNHSMATPMFSMSRPAMAAATVPEPATMAMGLMAGMLLLLPRRRR